jgi:hypothetical protein
MKKTQIHKIKKIIKERKTIKDQRQNIRRRKVSLEFVPKIATKIDSRRRKAIRKLAFGQGMSIRTIQNNLYEDLDLTKMSAR